MDVTKEKSNVFGKIAALRVSSEGYPKRVTTNSLASISQKTNSLDFLTDLCKSLIGFESLKDSLVDILVHNLDEIELDVKRALKSSLKSLVSCSINPSIPEDFKTNGITLELEKIDFLNMLKVAPTSQAGRLLYNDVYSGSETTDFNTYLYGAVQGSGESHFWGHVTAKNDILDIAFNNIGLTSNDPNNSILVKPSSFYKATNSKLTDLNNDYIDSIKLFGSNKLISSIVESVFGSISVNIKKDKKSLQVEIEIDEIIDRIINSDEEYIIDDSYFTFSNEEIQNIEYKAEMRRKGVKMITTHEELESNISIDSLTSLNSELEILLEQTSTPILQEEISTVIRNGLDSLANVSVDNVNSEDKLTAKINFIENMLRQLMKAIVSVILSPKLIVILSVNHYIVHGEGFSDVQDFMKKNKTLLTASLESVRDTIVAILMAKVLKEIKTLVAENIVKTEIEKIKYSKAQFLSLLGTNPETLRKIAGLTKT